MNLEFLFKYENMFEISLDISSVNMSPFITIKSKLTNKSYRMNINMVDIIDKNLTNLESKFQEYVKLERKYRLEYLLK